MVTESQDEKTRKFNRWTRERAREFWQSSGLTQAQIAERMDVHLTRVNDLCAADRLKDDHCYKPVYASTVARFCKAVGKSIQEFFEDCP